MLANSEIRIVKTLLVVYSVLDERIEFLEKKINHIAFASFDSLMSAEAVVDRVLERIARKQKLVVLKQKIDEMVGELPEKLERVISLCFLKKMTMPQVALSMDLSLRTVFRYSNEALEKLARKLEKVGLGFSVFKTLVEEFRWIATIHRGRVSKVERNAVDNHDKNIDGIEGCVNIRREDVSSQRTIANHHHHNMIIG